MSPRWHFGKPRIPARSLVLSAAALAVPIVAQLRFAEAAGKQELLLWLLAVLPAFLLAYYRGWRGAATALAAGMAALSVTQAMLLLTGHPLRDRIMLLGVVAAFILIALVGGWFMERLHDQRESAELLALTDDLTGLPNRRHAHMLLEPIFDAAADGRELSVVFFDLDRFKDYNDRHGHRGGDDALCAFARLLEALTPRGGFSCRYGGEEFVTVLPDVTAQGGAEFAHMVRTELGQQHGLLEPLTVSAGVAEYDASMASRGQLLAAADRALYAAKRGGRDCVRLHDPDAGTAEHAAAGRI